MATNWPKLIASGVDDLMFWHVEYERIPAYPRSLSGMGLRPLLREPSRDMAVRSIAQACGATVREIDLVSQGMLPVRQGTPLEQRLLVAAAACCSGAACLKYGAPMDRVEMAAADSLGIAEKRPRAAA